MPNLHEFLKRSIQFNRQLFIRPNKDFSPTLSEFQPPSVGGASGKFLVQSAQYVHLLVDRLYVIRDILVKEPFGRSRAE